MSPPAPVTKSPKPMAAALGSLRPLVAYWIPVCLSLLVVGFYFSPEKKLINSFYYETLLAPMVVYSAFNPRKTLHFFAQQKVFSLLLATLLGSSLINRIAPVDLAHQLTRLLYVTGFIGAVCAAIYQWPKIKLLLLPLIAITAASAACWEMFLWFSSGHSYGQRLVGSSAMDNPVLLGNVLAFGVLASFILFLRHAQTGSRLMWLYLLMVIPASMAMVMAQSRGPLLALAICLICAAFFIRSKYSPFLMLLFVLSIFAGANQLNRAHLDGPRWGIWSESLASIKTAPILGHGLQQSTRITVDGRNYDHHHSLYLVTWYHGGLPALLCLLSLIVIALLRGRHSATNTNWQLLLLFGLISIMADGKRLFESPDHIWLVFWLPLGILLAPAPMLGKNNDSS